jgi:4-hydroxybenzoate polyprenyltransferase
MRWLHFVLSHSIFVSLCAVALCYQTYILLRVPQNFAIYAFVFFSTLSSYNFYWLLSKYSFSRPVSWHHFLRKNNSYIIISIIAGAGMLYSLYRLPQLISYVSIAVVLTLLYSLPLWPFKWAVYLRKAGILKPVLLAFTWCYVTVLIPSQGSTEAPPITVLALMTARFFFVGMLCIIFDKRDMHLDKLHGLSSLATETGAGGMKIIMFFCFAIYIGAGVFARLKFFNSHQLLAFIITGAAVALVYRFSLKKQGYLFYYFVVDGLMFFSAGTTFIAALF